MKRLLWIIPLIIIILIVGLMIYVKVALPNVGPPPDITVEVTPARIERGEYLATSVMGCIDCHSQRDFSKFTGPVTGASFAGGSEDEFTEEAGLPGNFYAPNLTPYNLGNWTDGEIYRAITAGVAKDGRALFPVMAYHLYGQASQEDIYSVIAFLRTVEPFEHTVPKRKVKFPVNFLINTMPKQAVHKEIPDKNNKVEYGEYLITIAGCIDCHTPMEKGQIIEEKAYAGGMEFKMPNGGIVRSANLTPHKQTGLGNWSEEMFVNRFKVYADSLFIPQDVGEGFNTMMPWTMYAKMDEQDLKAIYAYLKSLEPQNNQVVKFTPPH